jgi:hypothetical protein
MFENRSDEAATEVVCDMLPVWHSRDTKVGIRILFLTSGLVG